MTMNVNEALTLLQTNVVFIECQLLSGHDTRLIYKCPAQLKPELGDRFVVHVAGDVLAGRGGKQQATMRVVECMTVHEDPPIKTMPWIIQKLDMTFYDDMVMQEHKFKQVLTKVNKAKQRKELADALITTGDSEIDSEIQTLLNGMANMVPTNKLVEKDGGNEN